MVVAIKHASLQWVVRYFVVDKAHDTAEIRHEKEYNYFILVLSLLTISYFLGGRV